MTIRAADCQKTTTRRPDGCVPQWKEGTDTSIRNSPMVTREGKKPRHMRTRILAHKCVIPQTNFEAYGILDVKQIFL